MNNQFFEKPISNSPYGYPIRHWELDEAGQPTQRMIETRRRAEFITPIPKPKKRKGAAQQESLLFDEGAGLTTSKQRYDHTAIINSVRRPQSKRFAEFTEVYQIESDFEAKIKSEFDKMINHLVMDKD